LFVHVYLSKYAKYACDGLAVPAGAPGLLPPMQPAPKFHLGAVIAMQLITKSYILWIEEASSDCDFFGCI